MNERRRIPTPLELARLQFYEHGDYTPEMRDYIATHQLDLDGIFAHAGLLAVALAEASGAGRFDFSPQGVLAAVIEVFAADGVTVVDLVAWPMDAPECFATAVGGADLLGINAAINAATFWGGRPLRVHRTPLGWVKAGCQGCCVLNPARGGYWLSKALQMAPAGAALLAEDLAHGRELRRLLPPGFDPVKLLVPTSPETLESAA